jgi:phosphate/sulfate permease
MPQVGFLSIITEFVGAVALGSRVTDTIKNGIINIDKFFGTDPGNLMLAMGCAEVGSATWLMFATVCSLKVTKCPLVIDKMC